MKFKGLSRDCLKYLAIISMIIDHVGKLFFPNIIFLRVIGRLAFPIFAFFIAEGFYYTRSRGKYLSKILSCAFVSQVPYYFLWGSAAGLNILFTFVFSILLLLLINEIIKAKNFNKYTFSIVLICFLTCCLILDLLDLIDYGLYGVMLPAIFYFFRNNKLLKFGLFSIATILFVCLQLINVNDVNFYNFIQLFAIFSIVFLFLYNEKLPSKKVNKYLFYFYYPFHLIVLFIIKIII